MMKRRAELLLTCRARDLERTRRRAVGAVRTPCCHRIGWSESLTDPMQILAAYGTLRMRHGYVLRALSHATVYRSRWYVVAVKEDAPVPGGGGILSGSRCMEYIEGDGTALSYMHAALLYRDLVHAGDRDLHSVMDDPARRPDVLTVTGGCGVEHVWKCAPWRHRVLVDGTAGVEVYQTRDMDPTAVVDPSVYTHGRGILVQFDTMTLLAPLQLLRSRTFFSRGGYAVRHIEFDLAACLSGEVLLELP